LLLGCGQLSGTGNNQSVIQDWKIVCDSSGSIFDQQDKLEKTLEMETRQFAMEAKSGSTIYLIGFTENGQAYNQKIFAHHTLAIKPPAWKSRKAQAKIALMKLKKGFKKMSFINQTPLLEVNRFEADLANRRSGRSWHLVIISDLMQTSPKLTLSPEYLKWSKDSDILREMLKICPPAHFPPERVTVYWYPGLLSKNKAIEPEAHERVRELFGDFLDKWAGDGCKIEMIPMEEV
jgi:hypothetical protein